MNCFVGRHTVIRHVMRMKSQLRDQQQQRQRHEGDADDVAKTARMMRAGRIFSSHADQIRTAAGKFKSGVTEAHPYVRSWRELRDWTYDEMCWTLIGSRRKNGEARR